MADPLGISFSPFNQQTGSGSGPSGPGRAPSPQDAIRILSLRLPRTVGANSPIPAPLLNAPGGASFGPSGQNLEQLLALLFGQRRPGMGAGPDQGFAPPSGLGGAPAQNDPTPMDASAAWGMTPSMSKTPAPFVMPGQREPRDPEQSQPLPGGTAGPGPYPEPTQNQTGALWGRNRFGQ